MQESSTHICLRMHALFLRNVRVHEVSVSVSVSASVSVSTSVSVSVSMSLSVSVSMCLYLCLCLRLCLSMLYPCLWLSLLLARSLLCARALSFALALFLSWLISRYTRTCVQNTWKSRRGMAEADSKLRHLFRSPSMLATCSCVCVRACVMYMHIYICTVDIYMLPNTWALSRHLPHVPAFWVCVWCIRTIQSILSTYACCTTLQPFLNACQMLLYIRARVCVVHMYMYIYIVDIHIQTCCGNSSAEVFIYYGSIFFEPEACRVLYFVGLCECTCKDMLFSFFSPPAECSCVYICVYVCTCKYIIFSFSSILATYSCICVCLCVNAHIHLHSQYLFVCRCARTLSTTSKRIRICVHLHLYIRICTNAYVCIV